MLQEMKELAMLAIIIFYISTIFIGIVDTYIKARKKQKKLKRELIHKRWEVARLRCTY